MLRLFNTLPLIALLTIGSVAMAQTTTEAPATEEAPATTTETAPAASETAPAAGEEGAKQESVLDLGEQAGANNPAGSDYVKQESGDWQLRCVRQKDGEEGEDDPCQLYQLLEDSDGNAVAEVSMFRLPDGNQAAAGATIIVPLETLLTERLTIAVDGGEGKVYPFAFCNPIGCYARIGLTNEEITAFKRGAKATVTIVPFQAPDQKVVLDLSLKGFTAGYDMASEFDPS